MFRNEALYGYNGDSFLDFLLAVPAFDNQSYQIHGRFHQPIHMGQIFGYEGRIHEGGTDGNRIVDGGRRVIQSSMFGMDQRVHMSDFLNKHNAEK